MFFVSAFCNRKSVVELLLIWLRSSTLGGRKLLSLKCDKEHTATLPREEEFRFGARSEKESAFSCRHWVDIIYANQFHLRIEWQPFCVLLAFHKSFVFIRFACRARLQTVFDSQRKEAATWWFRDEILETSRRCFGGTNENVFVSYLRRKDDFCMIIFHSNA